MYFSSSKPFFTALSAISIPGIPVWAGIQLTVIAVNESVCMVIFYLVPLPSYSNMPATVISPSRTDAESINRMISSSFFVYNFCSH